MGDEGRDAFVDARELGEGPADQAWQLQAVVRRQVRTHEKDLLLDEVVVVEQPFASRWRGALLARGRRQLPVVCRQRGCGLLGKGDQRGRAKAAGGGRLLLRGERRRLACKPVGREELGAQRRVSGRVAGRGRAVRLGHWGSLRRLARGAVLVVGLLSLEGCSHSICPTSVECAIAVAVVIPHGV